MDSGTNASDRDKKTKRERSERVYVHIRSECDRRDLIVVSCEFFFFGVPFLWFSLIACIAACVSVNMCVCVPDEFLWRSKRLELEVLLHSTQFGCGVERETWVALSVSSMRHIFTTTTTNTPYTLVYKYSPTGTHMFGDRTNVLKKRRFSLNKNNAENVVWISEQRRNPQKQRSLLRSIGVHTDTHRHNRIDTNTLLPR